MDGGFFLTYERVIELSPLEYQTNQSKRRNLPPAIRDNLGQEPIYLFVIRGQDGRGIAGA